MAKLSFAEWQSQGGDLADDLSEDAYKRYLNGPDAGAAGGNAASNYNLTLGMSDTPYQRPAGIPEYNGYQAPDYSATTPNNTHWLNTMNAFAPTARNDMSRLLGPGATGYEGGQMGGSQSTAPRQLTPGAMTAFGNVNDAAYAKRAQMPSTGLLAMPTQKPVTQMTGSTNPFNNVTNSAYTKWGGQTTGLLGSNTQQNNYQSPTNGWSNGTVGIDPSTGALTFLGNS